MVTFFSNVDGEYLCYSIYRVIFFSNLDGEYLWFIRESYALFCENFTGFFSQTFRVFFIVKVSRN